MKNAKNPLKFFVVFITFCLCHNSYAQSISGNVYCNITKKPVENAYVYLNGMTAEFSIDTYGRIDKKDHVVISGQFGNLRVGSMLPLNYEI